MPAEKRPDLEHSTQALEVRLRGLPQPRVAAGLEARLLATMPVKVSTQRRWVTWAGVVGPLAAALLLGVALWPRGGGKQPIRGSDVGEVRNRAENPLIVNQQTAHPVGVRAAGEVAAFAEWREARPFPGGAEPVSFSWPIQESSPITASIAIPADLLE
jgi:hypothetical protein